MKQNNIEILSYKDKHKLSITDREKFFGYYGNKLLTFYKPFTKVFNDKISEAEWYLNGTLNACYNCVDRHVLDTPDKIALIYSDNDGKQIEYTYNDLLHNVLIYTNLIQSLPINKNSCVTIYLPMSDEACFIALACARLGIPHNVVFGGYSSESLKKRMEDCKSSILFTTRTVKRENKTINFEENAFNSKHDKLTHIIFVNLDKKIKSPINYSKDFYSELEKENSFDKLEYQNNKQEKELKVIDFDKGIEVEFIKCKEVPSEHPLFYLYTSGSTGNPKGLIHTTAGYLVHITLSLKNSFGYEQNSKMLCTADLGWITGHSYCLYAPLALGSTTLILNGSPFYPSKLRLFELIDSNKITHLYTAPTAIRMMKKILTPEEEIESQKYAMKDLKLIGCVGEPINKDAYDWYSNIFRSKVVDTYFQTETGGFLITPIPNESKFEGECTGLPFFGVEPKVIIEEESKTAGESTLFENKGVNISIKEDSVVLPIGMRTANEGELGILLLKGGFPGMSRGILNNRERYLSAYFNKFEGYYLTGDEALIKDGHIYIRGRADDVINVSGHRISTAELESATCSHPNISESAVIGISDEITGQSIHIFVVSDKLVEDELRILLRKKIGSLIKPKKIYFVKSLPKTRTGKIMRRVLRSIVTNQNVGDVSTCANVESITEIQSLIL
ncbi:acetyl-coenzyme a synthetase [Tubulinosema ratisbonensis]|uniref:acetate--CoA ligase n=1 Tax=Tubulinosema ratisbonensis TaxID=291195 RepID=A0A437ALQ9_9MICR|nr:acetyl-coenzyme a synthetase [Tubulinosema ratisbonensis]